MRSEKPPVSTDNIAQELFGLPVSKKSINSKRKGDDNEREVSKWLTSWTGEKFTRVPSSGGLRWKNMSAVCGDVVCENQDFNFLFAVEAKAYQKLNIKQQLGKRNLIYTFFKQCVWDADRAGKLPLLIVRENGMKKGTFIVYFDELLPKAGLTLISAGKEPETGKSMYGYNSEELLAEFPYSEYIRWSKTR